MAIATLWQSTVLGIRIRIILGNWIRIHIRITVESWKRIRNRFRNKVKSRISPSRIIILKHWSVKIWGKVSGRIRIRI
jgi:hypothetical protein